MSDQNEQYAIELSIGEITRLWIILGKQLKSICCELSEISDPDDIDYKHYEYELQDTTRLRHKIQDALARSVQEC